MAIWILPSTLATGRWDLANGTLWPVVGRVTTLVGSQMVYVRNILTLFGQYDIEYA